MASIAYIGLDDVDKPSAAVFRAMMIDDDGFDIIIFSLATRGHFDARDIFHLMMKAHGQVHSSIYYRHVKDGLFSHIAFIEQPLEMMHDYWLRIQPLEVARTHRLFIILIEDELECALLAAHFMPDEQ